MSPDFFKLVLEQNGFTGKVADYALLYRTMYLSEKLSNPKLNDKKIGEILFEKMKVVFPREFTVDEYRTVCHINKFFKKVVMDYAKSVSEYTKQDFKTLKELVDEAITRDNERCLR